MQNWLSLLSTLSSRVTRRRTAGGLRRELSIPVQPAYQPLTGFSHLGVYEQSPWVYIAINRIAEAAALVPLRVVQLDAGTDGERVVDVVRHPLERLLDAPNPFMSRFELIEQTVGYLELTGNAYWFLSGNPDGTPGEIWTLRPDRVTIIPHPEQRVAGYLYQVDGQMIPLEPVEVVHFRRWHPASDFYGLSALEAARLSIQSDRAMQEWNRNTFGQDNGVPAGIVNIREMVSDADLERIKREWRTSYGGTQRRTAFLRGGSVEWHSIGLSHTDLDFLQGRKTHRDEILNIFGLPVGLVSENATEANAKVAERLFIERTLYPKLVRLAQKITRDLLPFWSGDCRAEFDDIRPTDSQARLDDIRAATAILSINELRERFYHLPPVTWGERPAGMQLMSTEGVGRGTACRALADDQAPESEPETGISPVKSTGGDGEVADPHAELARWERFALKRLGRSGSRPFEPRALPEELAFEIRAGLLAAQTEADVKAVFAGVKAVLTLTAEPDER